MYIYKHTCVNMYKYNWHISRNIQYNFIQYSTVKLINVIHTDSNQFMIRYKKNKKNNEINIGKDNVILHLTSM